MLGSKGDDKYMSIEYDDIRVCPYDGLPVMCDGDCENCEDCEDCEDGQNE